MMKMKRGSQLLSTSNALFGMNPLRCSLIQFGITQRQGAGKKVVMDLSAISTLLSIFCQQTTKSSMSVNCSVSERRLIDHCYRCVMALIRGYRGLFPCPVCLVPAEKLADTNLVFARRTAKDAKMLIKRASKASTKAQKEEILKSQSLRDVQVGIL